jgi:hypothetical protein
MNKGINLLNAINEFSILIHSQLPYGEQFDGDIIEWIESKLNQVNNQEKKILLNNVVEISLKYIQTHYNGNNDISINKLNADRVIDFAKNKEIGKLTIDTSKFDDAQLITLFRILTKDLKMFKNTQEDVKNTLCDIFGFGYDNVQKYFQDKKYQCKAKKIFKHDWSELL